MVLGHGQAREWIEAGIEPARAEELARHGGGPVTDFERYQQGNAVGNVRNKGPELLIPLIA